MGPGHTKSVSSFGAILSRTLALVLFLCSFDSATLGESHLRIVYVFGAKIISVCVFG